MPEDEMPEQTSTDVPDEVLLNMSEEEQAASLVQTDNGLDEHDADLPQPEQTPSVSWDNG